MYLLKHGHSQWLCRGKPLRAFPNAINLAFSDRFLRTHWNHWSGWIIRQWLSPETRLNYIGMIPWIQFHPIHHNSSIFQYIRSCHKNSPQMVGWKMTWKHPQISDLCPSFTWRQIRHLHLPSQKTGLRRRSHGAAAPHGRAGHWEKPSNAQVEGWILMRCIEIPWCLKIGGFSFNIPSGNLT